MTDKEKITRSLEILQEIQCECLEKDILNTNELLFLIGRVYGVLEEYD